MNVDLSGQMSGQAAQMNQVGGSGSGVGVSGANGLPQHQPMQDIVVLGGIDAQFVMLRNSMREKIFEYIGRKQSSAEWRRRLPELARRLEEILFGKFSNKNDYYTMMKGRIEPQLKFAIKTLSAQNQQNHQTPQTSRQIASSSGNGTMIPTPGMSQGFSGNSRIPYATDNNALSSSGASMVPQNANMGNSMQGAYDWKQELYQMNNTLKGQYRAGLSDLYEIYMKLPVDNHMPPQKPTNQYDGVKSFKLMLEGSLHSFQIEKSCVQLALEEYVPMYKRQITTIVNSEGWMPEETFQQSLGHAPSTSSSGIQHALGTLSPERSNVKRLRPSLDDDIHS